MSSFFNEERNNFNDSKQISSRIPCLPEQLQKEEGWKLPPPWRTQGSLLLDSGSISICKHFILLTSSSSSDITSIPPLIKQVHYISVSAINVPPAQDISTIVAHWFYYRKVNSRLCDSSVGFEKTSMGAIRKELAGGIVMRRQTRIRQPWNRRAGLGQWTTLLGTTSPRNSIRETFWWKDSVI